MFNLANSYYIKSKWDDSYNKEAILQLKEAAKFANSFDYKIVEGRCYNTLGLIYLGNKDYP